MVKIIKPTIGGHDGSSFRELIDLWSENGLCEIEAGPSRRSKEYSNDPDSPEAKCWIEEQGNVLLYDFPLLDRLKNEYKQCLFSNTYKEGKNNKKWIFWPWQSRVFDKKKHELRNAKKELQCGFIGTPTNHHRNSVASYWSQICNRWHLGGKISHEDYLTQCSKLKFGLCLPGVGPKCLRDVEYMGMGVIPVIMDRAAVDTYYNPPVENEHYIFVENVEEAFLKFESITEQEMESMSNACIEWFEENCSVEGSFKTTMGIIYG